MYIKQTQGAPEDVGDARDVGVDDLGEVLPAHARDNGDAPGGDLVLHLFGCGGFGWLVGKKGGEIGVYVCVRQDNSRRIYLRNHHRHPNSKDARTQIWRATEEAKGMMPMTVRMEMAGTTTSDQCGPPSKKTISGSSLLLSCHVRL